MTRVQALRRVGASLSAACLFAAVLACSSPYGFSLQRLYNQQQFSGKQLGGRTLIVGPVLMQHGPDTSGDLSLPSLLTVAHKARPELVLASPDTMSQRFLKKYDRASLDSFFGAQFQGDVLRLQSMDSLWALAGRRAYYMVLRLKSGMTVRSFDRKTSRRLLLEGELWDCDSSEVLWRTEVRGVSRGAATRDAAFVSSAVEQVYQALPVVLPANESGPW